MRMYRYSRTYMYQKSGKLTAIQVSPLDFCPILKLDRQTELNRRSAKRASAP
jgi:hypothetical protein